jgi:hypothetical protein
LQRYKVGEQPAASGSQALRQVSLLECQVSPTKVQVPRYPGVLYRDLDCLVTNVFVSLRHICAVPPQRVVEISEPANAAPSLRVVICVCNLTSCLAGLLYTTKANNKNYHAQIEVVVWCCLRTRDVPSLVIRLPAFSPSASLQRLTCKGHDWPLWCNILDETWWKRSWVTAVCFSAKTQDDDRRSTTTRWRRWTCQHSCRRPCQQRVERAEGPHWYEVCALRAPGWL